MGWKLAARIAPLAAVAALAGCASLKWEANPALLPQGLPRGTPYTMAAVPDATGDAYLILFAFSGGGKRSASFGYGALMGAHETAMPAGSNLADQIDVVSGVSGGSFTASAFAEYHDALFDGRLVDPLGVEHPPYKEFLASDTNAAIFSIYLEPWRWQWLVSPDIGTNDEMARTYGHDLLGETTYGDLARRGRPYLIVQATDLDAQQPFTFTQTDFDLICSDLSSVKVARAVAASNGFPVLFSPIALQMYSYSKSPANTSQAASTNGPCPALSWEHPDTPYPPFSREAQLVTRSGLYAPAGMSADKPSFVHLADGGLSDNLALRGPMSIWMRLKMQIPENCAPAMPSGADADTCGKVEALRLRKIKHILVVSVDGEAEPDRSEGLNAPILSGLTRIGGSVLNSVIDSANLSTLPMAADTTTDIRNAIWRLRCSSSSPPAGDPKACAVPKDGGPPYVVFAHVSLSDWAKQAPGREDVANSPTGLSLRNGDAEKLIEAGREALKSNPDINCFLRNVGETPGGPVSAYCPTTVAN